MKNYFGDAINATRQRLLLFCKCFISVYYYNSVIIANKQQIVNQLDVIPGQVKALLSFS